MADLIQDLLTFIAACFNVASGDVEDAPALDPLAKFEIIEKDGGVYIKGDEKTIQASRRQPKTQCTAQGQEKVVVVGGLVCCLSLHARAFTELNFSGSGAMGTVQALREQGYKGAVTIISSEPNLPIDRTKLSKALIADESKIQLRPRDWFKTSSIETGR